MEHGGKREGAGRKPVNTTRGAKKQGSVYLYEDTWDRIISRAEANGVSTSTALQELLDAGTQPVQLPAGRKKRQPLSEIDFINRALLARGITTPSLMTRLRLERDYADYLQTFE